ncbi:MAG: SPOR domain-containing protein [Bacteroidales bacterium]
MNNFKIYLILILLMLPFVILAQQRVVPGEVNIIQDERVNTLVEKHIQNNQNFSGSTGYRIQIFFDSGSNAKNRANNERRRFLALYPQSKAYVTFDAPNFKVRVGDFRSRLEAERFLKDIQKHFEMAYVVPSKIELPSL